MLDAPGGLKGCPRSSSTGKFIVKLFLGGEQKILGSFDNEHNAARFADACIRHFWKYRKTTKELSDLELNFGLAQANADRETIPGLSQTLCEIEAHLISVGTLKDFEGREAEKLSGDMTSLRKTFHAFNRRHAKVCYSLFQRYERTPDAKAIILQAKETLRQLDACMHSLFKIQNQ